jgi:hypothetical protein
MSNPTGSLKLVFDQSGVGSGRRSRATAIVLAYLLVNIAARLSVAIFGIAYDLSDNAGVQYPITVHDFSTAISPGTEWNSDSCMCLGLAMQWDTIRLGR